MLHRQHGDDDSEHGGAFSANAGNISSGTIGQAFLPSDVVYNNQANAYTAGSKQTLGASTTTAASLNLPVGVTPTSPVPVAGDIWLDSNDAHIQFDASSGSQKLAFLSDVTSATLTAGTGINIDGGNQINNTGVLSVASGDSNINASTASGAVTVSLNSTINANTTGNAATATNVPYSGLTGPVPTWNQDTTGNAATATSVTGPVNGSQIVGNIAGNAAGFSGRSVATCQARNLQRW